MVWEEPNAEKHLPAGLGQKRKVRGKSGFLKSLDV